MTDPRRNPHQPMDEIAAAVARAVLDEGPAPRRHREVMARHRAEWPALWRAIDALVEQWKAEKDWGRLRAEHRRISPGDRF